jgi:hypothetical protein
MNPIIRYLILQKIRAFIKAKEEGKMKKFSFVISLEKFIQGGGITFIATVLALLLQKETTQAETIAKDVGNNLLVSIPIIGALLASIVNAVKFFIKK